MNETTNRYAVLYPGDAAPWFRQRTPSNPEFGFDVAAGRYVVLCFFGSAADPVAQQALRAVALHRTLFDDERACFFGVTLDPTDAPAGRVADKPPGLRFFLDLDGAVSRLYGSAPRDSQPGDRQVTLRRFWLVLDPLLRVMRVFAFETAGRELTAVFDYLAALPPPAERLGFALPPPVLFVPDVFEATLCRALIDAFEADGGTDAGFMQEQDGKTVARLDAALKRRRDFLLHDPGMIEETRARIQRRILPEVQKVHHFKATRLERSIVGRYTAEDGGHFSPHRDNTARGTAHRRFAVSINLNDDYDGGLLAFPEYGGQAFKMPAGTAAVFSCSLLHAVRPMTRGRRYTFLPFLYDDEAAQQRLANNAFLGDDVPFYSDPELGASPTTSDVI